jgi:beta-phosphoglucomutase-like phosphatase (HAD superfamily)
MNTIVQALQAFLSNNNYAKFDLKAVLFDMDGVLYDSMPNHAGSWHTVMKSHGLDLSYEEAYLHEGRKGSETIRMVCQRQGVEITDEEITAIYKEKTEIFKTLPEPKRMAGSYELLQTIVNNGLIPMLVTGSGQVSLLADLNISFLGIFRQENMVTSFDVKLGKPNPEPYLMALEKGNLKPWEAVVIENAPLGVEAAHKAGLFVIAVNTGPLPDACLWDAGAHLLYPSITALNNKWEKIPLGIHAR